MIGEEEYDKIRSEFTLTQETLSKGTVRCRWGSLVYVIKHKAQYDCKDINGETISKESADHLSRFRVKWKDCKDIFWAKWLIRPYHLGFTCSEYREFIESDKWRFCDSPMK